MQSIGVTSFRLNTSHLTIQQLEDWIGKYQEFLSSSEVKPPLVLDLQGSKWRLGEFSAFVLELGQTVELVNASSADREGVLPIPHLDFFRAVSSSSGRIVINDAKILLMLESAGIDSIRAKVIQGGDISSNKGITLTDAEYRIESLTHKDQKIWSRTKNLNFIRYAISYVKDSDEIAHYRGLMGDSPCLIAKLERESAIDDAEEISRYVNEMWLCRGDLGSESGLKAMAEAVQRFSERVITMQLPVFLAGQVLEHMVQQPVPTRSEICYIYEALIKGYRGIVLSDETAIGHYPIESCQVAALFRK